MKKKSSEIIRFFRDHGGVVRFSAIIQAGFHPDSLSALEKEKSVEKIARGLYRLADHTLGSHPDLVMALLQAPKGVICLLSALSFHEATNEVPRSIDIAIPQGSRANIITYPPARFYRFSPQSWKEGIEIHEIGKHKIRVYGLAKTIADCVKFRNKIGMNVARDALKTAITEKGVKPGEIMRYAKICRVDTIVKPILEALL